MPHVSTRPPANFASTACAADDLICICTAGADMSAGMYFSHCVFLEYVAPQDSVPGTG